MKSKNFENQEIGKITFQDPGLKPGAFKLLVYSPTVPGLVVDSPLAPDEVPALLNPRERLEVLGVAVQVEFEKQTLKPVFHFS